LEQIPNYDDFDKIVPIIDINNSKAAVIDNGVVTVRTGLYVFQPIFASKHLIARQNFCVEITNYAYGWFSIGVATADLRDRAGEYHNTNSLCMYGNNLFNSSKQKHNFKLKSGDTITIRRCSD
jgi:hypothetical protein